MATGAAIEFDESWNPLVTSNATASTTTTTSATTPPPLTRAVSLTPVPGCADRPSGWHRARRPEPGDEGLCTVCALRRTLEPRMDRRMSMDQKRAHLRSLDGRGHRGDRSPECAHGTGRRSGTCVGFLDLGEVVTSRLPWAARCSRAWRWRCWWPHPERPLGGTRSDAATAAPGCSPSWVGSLLVLWILIELAFIRELQRLPPALPRRRSGTGVAGLRSIRNRTDVTRQALSGSNCETLRRISRCSWQRRSSGIGTCSWGATVQEVRDPWPATTSFPPSRTGPPGPSPLRLHPSSSGHGWPGSAVGGPGCMPTTS